MGRDQCSRVGGWAPDGQLAFQCCVTLSLSLEGQPLPRLMHALVTLPTHISLSRPLLCLAMTTHCEAGAYCR